MEASSPEEVAERSFTVYESAEGHGSATVYLRHLLDADCGSHLLRFSCALWVYNCTGFPVALQQSDADESVSADQVRSASLSRSNSLRRIPLHAIFRGLHLHLSASSMLCISIRNKQQQHAGSLCDMTNEHRRAACFFTSITLTHIYTSLMYSTFRYTGHALSGAQATADTVPQQWVRPYEKSPMVNQLSTGMRSMSSGYAPSVAGFGTLSGTRAATPDHAQRSGSESRRFR